MSEIDWGKPLRNADVHDDEWLFLANDPQNPGWFWCRPKESWIAERFNLSGVCWHGKIVLENIPPEPEREEGEMWLGLAGTEPDPIEIIATWHTDTWWENGDAWHTFKPLQRVYRFKEYRPADTCPPPLTGEKFEIEGESGTFRGVWSEEDEAFEWVVCGEGHYRSFAWIRDKRWRPIQEPQS